MTLDEIRQTLALALPVRTPTFEHGTPAHQRVAGIEDYMFDAAVHHGSLVEARHWLRHAEDELRRKVDEMQGWEQFMSRRGSGAPTRPEIDRAKRQLDPGLFAAGREVRLLRGSVDDQIARFEFEQSTLSRVYSLISGS